MKEHPSIQTGLGELNIDRAESQIPKTSLMCSHITHIRGDMANMTLSIPENLYGEMQRHPEIRWSEVARQAFEMKVRELHWMDEVLRKSKLTEEDAERIGHKIKHEIAKRFLKKSSGVK